MLSREKQQEQEASQSFPEPFSSPSSMRCSWIDGRDAVVFTSRTAHGFSRNEVTCNNSSNEPASVSSHVVPREKRLEIEHDRCASLKYLDSEPIRAPWACAHGRFGLRSMIEPEGPVAARKLRRTLLEDRNICNDTGNATC